MAQVIVTFGKSLTRDQDGGAQLMSAHGCRTEELATSGTSGATTIVAAARDVAMIVNNADTLVWVEFGTAPVAVAGTSFPVPGNFVQYFGGLGNGSKCAVVDDS